ncbi:MAG: hypothetical protein L0Y54_21410, partial [Sporichthyaceae bacterium]|nr:hypothetical protein [Sporichthyaceae bacterium]
MNVRRETSRRWFAVGGAVLAVCALPVVVSAWPVPQPDIDVATLHQRVLASAERPYQGYVESDGRISLPDLRELGVVSRLLGGTTRIRAWYAGPNAWRVAELTTTGERDIYRSAAGTFVWDFERTLLTQILGAITVR